MRQRLYRSRSDRMLFGVAGGMARYLDLDPSLVRIAWVLLVFAGGAGLLLYIVAAIVIPEEPHGATAAPPEGTTTPDSGSAWSYRAGTERRNRGGSAVLIGVVLVVVGAWLLLQRFVQIDSGLVWPVALLILGGALVLGAMRR